MNGPVKDPLLLDLPMAIQTARLALRPPREGDGQALYEGIVETLPALRQFLASLPWVGGEQSPQLSEAWARNASANFIARKDFPFLMFTRDTGELVGAIGLHRPEWTVPKVEIGYWCRASRSGQGLVIEGVSAIIDYAFEHLRALRLEIVTDEENLASRQVALRCGFTLEGTQRHERRAPDGSLRNTCLYGRLRA
ncbi:MAG TPA: GNAT family N-acetyltransferase [Ramlibacter sp.]|nr:GNAT family N-acetyltransferase [Ramlibacter sp.]